MDEATKLPIGPEEVAEAAQILQRYKAGKAALDKRLVDNDIRVVKVRSSSDSVSSS